MNNIINKFIDELVRRLERENDDRKYKEKRELDIPYIIAPLSQFLLEDKYKEFIQDITTHSYFINYFEDNTGGYTNGYIEVNLYVNDNEEDDGYYCSQCELHSYKIEFGKNQRHWGYCECEPEDEDYRKDKDCCGHGCDWTAPTFSVEKITSLGSNGWKGDAHDFWDYEDNFYKSNEELAKEKEEKERLERVEFLHKEIQRMNEELSKIKTA